MRLRDLIAQQKKEGTTVGSGAFTLSEEHFHSKIYKHATPQEAVLRVVQVATELGFDKLNINVLQNGLRLEFGNLRNFEWEQSEELNPNGSPLGLAFASCIKSGYRKVEFSLDEIRDLTNATLKREPYGNFWQKLRHKLLGRVDDLHELRNRLEYHPHGVRCDALAVTPELDTALLYDLHLLGHKGLSSQSILSHPAEGCRVRILRGKSTACHFFRRQTIFSETDKVKVRYFTKEKYNPSKVRDYVSLAQIQIPQNLSGLSTLKVVKSGVVIGQLDLELPIGLRGAVSGAGLDADVCGLKLVHNNKSQKIARYLKKLVIDKMWKTLKLQRHLKPDELEILHRAVEKLKEK